ncbi:MAG: phasin family protein [Rhodocyclaceae bacterium]|nr:MAG: phasin family protein [Rhodocyclaceae bacterium]
MWMSPGAARFVAIQQAAVDAYCAATSSMLAATERMALLSLATGRELLAASAADAGVMVSARTMPEAFLVHATLALPAVAKAMVFSREIHEFAAGNCKEWRELSKAHVTGLRKAVFQSAPVVAQPQANGILATAETATANLTTILRRLNELMEAEMSLERRARQGQVSATRDLAVSDKTQED